MERITHYKPMQNPDNRLYTTEFCPASLENQHTYWSDAFATFPLNFLSSTTTHNELPIDRSRTRWLVFTFATDEFMKASPRIPNTLTLHEIRGPREGRREGGRGTRHEEARSSWRIQLLITLLMLPLVHGPTTKFNTSEVYYSSGGHAFPRTWGGQPQGINEYPLNWILVIIKRSTGIQWLTN